MSALFAFFHHLAAFTLVSALAVEFVLIREELTLSTTRRLLITDTVFGASAAFVFAVGLLRVFFFEKGAEYYWSSHAFLTKFAVFLLVGLLSVVPTREFLSWRKAIRAGQTPEVNTNKLKTIRHIVHFELMGIVIILLAAALMARGGWV